MKKLTREQVQARKEKAARFTETVVGDPDRADEIRGESLEDYKNARYLLLKAKRMVVTNTEFVELQQAKKAA